MVFNLLIKINNDYLNNKKNGKKEWINLDD